MVFEYMEADLSGLLGLPSFQFTLAHVKCLMHQLLSGLDILHDQGYMHRDCKASNLLLNNNGQLKLADFGLATNYKQRDRFGSAVVTLWYRGKTA